jgi:hypothetical protein
MSTPWFVAVFVVAEAICISGLIEGDTLNKVLSAIWGVAFAVIWSLNARARRKAGVGRPLWQRRR